MLSHATALAVRMRQAADLCSDQLSSALASLDAVPSAVKALARLAQAAAPPSSACDGASTSVEESWKSSQREIAGLAANLETGLQRLCAIADALPVVCEHAGDVVLREQVEVFGRLRAALEQQRSTARATEELHATALCDAAARHESLRCDLDSCRAQLADALRLSGVDGAVFGSSAEDLVQPPTSMAAHAAADAQLRRGIVAVLEEHAAIDRRVAKEARRSSEHDAVLLGAVQSAARIWSASTEEAPDTSVGALRACFLQLLDLDHGASDTDVVDALRRVVDEREMQVAHQVRGPSSCGTGPEQSVDAGADGPADTVDGSLARNGRPILAAHRAMREEVQRMLGLEDAAERSDGDILKALHDALCTTASMPLPARRSGVELLLASVAGAVPSDASPAPAGHWSDGIVNAIESLRRV